MINQLLTENHRCEYFTMTPLVSLVEHEGNTALDGGGWLVAGLGAEKQSKQSRERERGRGSDIRSCSSLINKTFLLHTFYWVFCLDIFSRTKELQIVFLSSLQNATNKENLIFESSDAVMWYHRFKTTFGLEMVY